MPPVDTCVLFLGSLGAAYEERIADRWTPGAIGAIDRFRCSTYYPRLGPALANADAVFTTVAKLVAHTKIELELLECRDRIFVRPDSPLKPFAGRELATGRSRPTCSARHSSYATARAD